jgi:hypothetical protein
MTHELQDYFKKFDEMITLDGKQAERMEKASEMLMAFLVDRFNLATGDVFVQGSYPNGTAVEPVDGGEYDVDIVCVSVDGDVTSEEALDHLTAVLESDGIYAPRVGAPKSCCVRLESAEDEVGKFHIDVVPVRPGQRYAPLDAPRRDEEWHGTSPREYTDWCRNQGVNFARTVKAAKRWRDEHQTVRGAIKSIVLQVLLAQCMPRDTASDARRLHSALRNMQQLLAEHASPPVVTNPVLDSENLAARWTQESYDEFRAELDEAVELTTLAINTDDAVEAVETWRELLGDDFPAERPESFGIKLASDAHAHTPGANGWTTDLDPRYHVEILATQQLGKRTKRAKRYSSNGPLLFAGRKLCFRAITSGPGDAEIWWQVANTGAHAREKQGLRGEYFKAKKLNGNPSDDEAENWEDTSYTGAHWIRAVLVKSGTVVAQTSKFVVNVYNKQRWFGH